MKYDYWKNGVVAKRQVAGAFAANMQYENDKVYLYRLTDRLT
ncbi:hypothetical protein [Paenibacillus taiwanensis]|nr:hypothetical protein [Paenibacillus taiwanensis]